MGVKMKIIIPVIVLTFLITVSILVVNIFQFSKNIDNEMLMLLNASGDSIADHIEGYKSAAKTAALYVATDDRIIDALERGDHNALLSRANEMDMQTGLDFSVFTDKSGIVVLRTSDPDNFGDDISSVKSISSALNGVPFTSAEEGTTIQVAAVAAVPIYSRSGGLLGVVSTGYCLDTTQFVDSMKDIFDVEVTVFKGDVRVATTVKNADGSRAIGTKAAENVSSTVLAGKEYEGQAVVVGKNAFVKYLPIFDADGKVLGMLFVGRYTQEKQTAIRNFVLIGALIAAALLAVGIVAIIFIADRIVKPLTLLTTFMKKASTTGDITFTEEEATDIDRYSKVKDEIGLTIGECILFINRVGEVSTLLEAIASGDLVHDANRLSESDTMGNALHHLFENLNGMFVDIRASADQVSTGSKQVADGAQTLAHGATEQAASIEQLSSSISDIAQKTKENSHLANNAAELAGNIKDNAEKGSRQMDEMMSAVGEINEASSSISKVIKVIDDIAFQTNILALNAAVEAARAGQHGKGFAVVAEEVRSLAAKSAEAAKDTGGLIENSIEKANLGVRIAEETSLSLSDIVSGINESTQIVMEIAQASEEQTISIGQINTGIDQVAQVVQQNSATAEESAAASEEMSAQAATLQELIAQFKLKN